MLTDIMDVYFQNETAYTEDNTGELVGSIKCV